MKRIELVPIEGILSAYRNKVKPYQRLDVSYLKEKAMGTPDMVKALISLDQAVTDNQGNMYVTSLLRTWEEQDKTRQDYVESTKTKIKKAYASPPGSSFHQAGRAVDIAVKELNFKTIPREKWLKKFWDLSKPLGFRPIISIPDLDISESWHFMYLGKDWSSLYDYADRYATDKIDYALVCKCCILDIGKFKCKDKDVELKMFIQAQLLRLGKYEIGDVDGILGNKTKTALYGLGIDSEDLQTVAAELCSR